MRTIVDLPEDTVQALDKIGKDCSVSRAELVRRAVSEYLENEKKKKTGEMVDDVFGLLKDCPDAFDGLDGLEYQRKIRSEWDHRDKMYSNWGMSDVPQEPIRRDE